MRSRVLPFLMIFAGLWAGAPAFAQDEDENYDDQEDDQTEVQESKTGKQTAKDNPKQAAEAAQMRVGSSQRVRRFHEVLDELLAEFGYDIKMGQIKDLSNVSVRKVRVSTAIPRTYEDYVEMLLVERIRENSQVRLIACVPCKTKTSQLVDGKLMITSPATNMAKLESTASQLGIENFMDAVLVYHTTHMVLAVNVFNAQTKELVWARTYNSETVKSRYQKLAIDYSQVAKSRPGEDYQPEYRSMWGFGVAQIPNVSQEKKDASMLNLQIRATEKFNNRRTEFGMLVSVLKTTTSTLKDHPTEEPVEETTTETTTPPDPAAKPKPKAFSQAFGVYGLYSHLFVGSVESYNETRHGAHLGLGGLAATGYLAPAFRLGWDVYMGRRFSASVGGNYIGSSTVIINKESYKTKGGPGADFILSVNY